MFLNRIKSNDSGILLYGITPPKSQTAPEKVSEIAEKTLARLHGLDIDVSVSTEEVPSDEDRSSRGDSHVHAPIQTGPYAIPDSLELTMGQWYHLLFIILILNIII